MSGGRLLLLMVLFFLLFSTSSLRVPVASPYSGTILHPVAELKALRLVREAMALSRSGERLSVALTEVAQAPMVGAGLVHNLGHVADNPREVHFNILVGGTWSSQCVVIPVDDFIYPVVCSS
jgi:hypothetical protein